MNTSKRIFEITGAILSWFALIFQFYLIILNRTASISETIINYFSFYTILTNILVAICFSSLVSKQYYAFFTKPATLTAVTVYITIVGIIYNLVLRELWAPEGLQLIVDELLHLVIPLLFMGYWFLFVPKQSLQWKNIYLWLIFPAAYCIYVMIRGNISGAYPYPFMNAHVLGYNKVMMNIGAIIILFMLLSFILVAISKVQKSR